VHALVISTARSFSKFGFFLASFLTSAAILAASSFAGERDPWLARDKAMHFSASFMLAGDGYAGTSLLTRQEHWRAGIGVGVAIAAGAGKEIYDIYGGGDPSLRDLTWDVVGATTGAMVSWIIDRYLF
jgi:uncharacterized protein YfiM (DUF2279 family)